MKDPRRSGNPAKRAKAEDHREAQLGRELFGQAIAIGIGNLLSAGFRIVDPKGVDVTASLAQELDVELAEPAPEEKSAGTLLVVQGGKVDQRDVKAATA